MAQDAKEKDTVSFLLGYNLGGQIAQMPYEVAIESFMEGFQKAVKGEESGVSDEDANRILSAWQNKMQQEMQARQMEESMKEAAANKEAGRKFMEENAKQEGVQQTASGLQYKVNVMGTGAKPAATDRVKVHYEGRLLSGEKFDSSIDRGEPTSFPLNAVIRGWTEGLQLMPVGSKFTFYIPAELGYGDRAVSTIPAGSTLVFDVELIEINPAE
ncbi:MAG: FKBP-type peptidyl-prolyl cis-trans isomerase [Bacteroidales bacterium]|nr:FKBP-type peptidyl-prolyl cis-trans isomerase [Bacteroidales bacterium]MDE7091207.1 FKBP-type peptidyl-prolyl cis-trans isomerase [Bacteroidales bacterium]MDE7104045.1 FKBP-type peptidyl-prolyl cis-trans isomerase [Bacteroidales bacterium]